MIEEPPLTREEINDWLETLAPTLDGKIEVLRQLIRYAVRDNMSAYDKQVCHQELMRLRTIKARQEDRVAAQ